MDYRKSRFRRSQSDEPHNSALNDILFILMFFFLITATLANPDVVKIANAKGKSDTKAKQTIVVTVDSTGNYYVGTKATVLDSLGSAITADLENNVNDTTRTLVINGDKGASWQNIMNVMMVGNKLKMHVVGSVKP